MQHKPKKRLGQHFLVDENIQRKIIAHCQFSASDIVLEIGAGSGVMTRQIAPCVKKLFALEIDRSLVPTLESIAQEYSSVHVINADFLTFNLASLFKTHAKIKVFGNIPYYITTAIIERLLSFHKNIEIVFLTVQKDFALRITAQPGSKQYGAFSCFVQYYTHPAMLFTIKRNSFFPAPSVDSALLRLAMNDALPLRPTEEKILFSLIRTAFQQRRKMLSNTLAKMVPSEKLALFFKKNSLDERIRPEQLSLTHFLQLAKGYVSKKK
ncbi:MAG: ribosomal RNA small subunit methyltransferase A [Candidatus Omnitrophica bacterium]|nr:ribosomal RNA small subunit methyltransferase A [Candidatus Omnitrophota bacterium]